jgi:hypothetical protein
MPAGNPTAVARVIGDHIDVRLGRALPRLLARRDPIQQKAEVAL